LSAKAYVRSAASSISHGGHADERRHAARKAQLTPNRAQQSIRVGIQGRLRFAGVDRMQNEAETAQGTIGSKYAML